MFLDAPVPYIMTIIAVGAVIWLRFHRVYGPVLRRKDEQIAARKRLIAEYEARIRGQG